MSVMLVGREEAADRFGRTDLTVWEVLNRLWMLSSAILVTSSPNWLPLEGWKE